MKAIRIHSYGHSDLIKFEETEMPQPGEDEVLVKIQDAGVNPVDWKIREGLLIDFLPKNFPFTLGQDFSGEVIHTGSKVTGFKAGDPVFGFTKDGSYAEFALASPKAIALKPATMDFAQAAAIPTAGLTAWQMIIDVARVSLGQRVLIHGSAGGVGSFAVQFAKWKGADIWALAASRDFDYLNDLGVEHKIDYKSERFEEKIRDCDVVIDLVGGEILSKSYGVVKKGGVLITTVGEINQEECKKLGIRGVEFTMKQDGLVLSQIAKLVEQGLVHPRLSSILPFSDAAKAQEMNEDGRSQGKIILKVA